MTGVATILPVLGDVGPWNKIFFYSIKSVQINIKRLQDVHVARLLGTKPWHMQPERPVEAVLKSRVGVGFYISANTASIRGI